VFFYNLHVPWKKLLIIKLLEKSIVYIIFYGNGKALWRLEGGFQIINVPRRIFKVFA